MKDDGHDLAHASSRPLRVLHRGVAHSLGAARLLADGRTRGASGPRDRPGPQRSRGRRAARDHPRPERRDPGDDGRAPLAVRDPGADEGPGGQRHPIHGRGGARADTRREDRGPSRRVREWRGVALRTAASPRGDRDPDRRARSGWTRLRDGAEAPLPEWCRGRPGPWLRQRRRPWTVRRRRRLRRCARRHTGSARRGPRSGEP